MNTVCYTITTSNTLFEYGIC